MNTRHKHNGVRKICACPRRAWPKCVHSWFFNYKVPGGESFRFSIDVEVGKHIASKTAAEALAEDWRPQMRAGTFRRRAEIPPPPPAPAPPVDVVTLDKFLGLYFERAITKRGNSIPTNDRGCLRTMAAFVIEGRAMSTLPLASITADAVEEFFAAMTKTGGRGGQPATNSTRNKYVQAVKAAFRWAAKKGYLDRNPISDSDALTRKKAAQRNRRLDPGEEEALLANADPHLYRLIVGAVESCARRGELLSLTWRDTSLERREMTIQDEKTKTGEGRVLPISNRLAAVLDMAKTDPTGKEFGPDDFVFGDVVGRQVKDVSRAWECCVLKAHGYTPTYTKTNALSKASRAALKTVNLAFHDLRHEAGSRLLEGGWPLHAVAHMLGHSNISQTSTYLNAGKVHLQAEMQRLDAARCNAVAMNEAKGPSASLQRTNGKGSQLAVN